MQVHELHPADYPQTLDAIDQQVQQASLADQDLPVSVFGGAARNALIEAFHHIVRPLRDIDIIAFGDACSDERYAAIHSALNPSDKAPITVIRHPSVEELFQNDLDFTINQAVINLGSVPRLTASALAIDACMSQIIMPTDSRIAQTKALEAGGEQTKKQFLRNQTNMPARAAYFTATLRAAGLDFSLDMLDHPQPASPEAAHTFFLGLVVRKCLQIDEAERGEGDILATSLLIDLFEEMGLTDAVKPKNVEDVVKFCEQINAEHPHLKFYGSKIASLVAHVEDSPKPTS